MTTKQDRLAKLALEPLEQNWAESDKRGRKWDVQAPVVVQEAGGEGVEYLSHTGRAEDDEQSSGVCHCSWEIGLHQVREAKL